MKRARAAVAAALAAFIFYAFWVEPLRIEVTRHSVKAPVRQPIKIAHLSDLHIGRFGRRQKKLLALLAQEKPDAIVITGDCVTHRAAYSAIAELMGQLRAPLGVYFVRGNWEHWMPPPADVESYPGVRVLENASARLIGKIWLVGLDDAFAGSPDMETALKGVPKDAFKLALFHSPAFFTIAASRVEIALAGHTHGGQLRLPFVGPLYLPPGSRPFVQGWYERAGARLYVSRGLGNSLIDARLFCRPELPIVTLEP